MLTMGFFGPDNREPSIVVPEGGIEVELVQARSDTEFDVLERKTVTGRARESLSVEFAAMDAEER